MAKQTAKKSADWANEETRIRLSEKYQVSLGSIGIVNADFDYRPHLFIEGKHELILISNFEEFLNQVTDVVHRYRLMKFKESQIAKPDSGKKPKGDRP